MATGWNGGSLKTGLDALASVAFIAACAAIVWSIILGRTSSAPAAVAAARNAAAAPARPAPPLPAEPVSLDGAVLRGNPKAKVAVIEYSEFECPFCGKFARETLPDLEKKYIGPGKVLWAFRHFPLEKIHQNALRAGIAGECAGRQDKFWPMHDLLFKNQTQLESASLSEYARTLGLDFRQFDACMKESGAASAEAKIRTDIQTAGPLVITGTPTFFTGRVQANGSVRLGRRLTGALPVNDFETEIDKELAEVGSAQ